MTAIDQMKELLGEDVVLRLEKAERLHLRQLSRPVEI